MTTFPVEIQLRRRPPGLDPAPAGAQSSAWDDCGRSAMSSWSAPSAPAAADRALPLGADVGLDALDELHVEVTEVLHLVLDLDAGLAVALALLLAQDARLALLAQLRLAVQLRERRLASSSQG